MRKTLIVLGLLWTGSSHPATAQLSCERFYQLSAQMSEALQSQKYDIALTRIQQLKPFVGRCDGAPAMEVLNGLEQALSQGKDRPQVMPGMPDMKPCNPIQTGPTSYSC